MTPALPSAPPKNALHITLWVLQVLLGVMMAMAGVMKATQPVAELATNMVWVSSVPVALLRFIGISELAGGLGLILPAATRIRPALTPLAALGLAIIQVLALPFHVSRDEMFAVPINVVLFVLLAFVAWGRHRLAPIASK